jgi:hypothetical protein
MKKTISFASLSLLVMILLACSPTIGNKTDLEKITFEVGKTTKREVAEQLGFPSAIQKNEETGNEYWAYQKKPNLSGLILPIVAGDYVYTSELPINSQSLFEDAALVCEFDNNGILAIMRGMK